MRKEYTDPRPIGKNEAIAGAEHQTFMIRWICDEVDKLLTKAKKDDTALAKACSTLWAMHLAPLAAHRMLADYITQEPVDHRPTDEQYDAMRQESAQQRKRKPGSRKAKP